MSRYYKIRWNKSDDQEIKKTVKNFNAKIGRLEKKYDKLISQETDREKRQQLRIEKNALPERTSAKQMKELVDTRTDLNRELNALKRFSKRGAEEIVESPGTKYNLQITKWQRNEMSRRAGVINRKRKDRYEEIYNLVAEYKGQKLGYKIGDLGMGSVDENQLRPINAFTPSMSRADVNKKMEVLIEESQSMFWDKKELIMKQNYKDALLQSYDEEDIEKVLKAIDDMDFKDFYYKFMAQVGKFENVYFPDREKYWDHVSDLNALWVPEPPPTQEAS